MKTTFTSKTSSRALLCLAGLLCFVLAAPKARADEPEPADPPSRAARISFVEGTVSFQPGGDGDWGAAAKNRPTTVGDKLWTDRDSRAELQTGQATIHMGSMTALSFLNLDENIMQVRIAEGVINFRVRELREGDLYEVDTPNLAFTVKQAGAFRVEVNETGDATRVTAIRGEGEVTAGGKTYTVHSGEQAELTGTDNPEFRVSSAPPPDGLDRWASERDLREDNSTSARYVSRDVPGYSDLDDNGSWREEPEYGAVWYPNSVPVGWAPYSYGAWNWVGPWGWSWVGYEPWGYAPFHYGRWEFIGGGWGWCPGPIFARPFFGPAFVGFLGGSGFSFGFGFGGGFGVGWFPLGFREPFFPGFRCSRTFITNINIRNTNVRNVNVFNSNRNFNYAYAHNVRAVTATSRNTFVNGQMVNRGAAHVTAASLRGAQVSNRTSFTPTRQSSLGATNVRARVSTPPASVQSRSVVARTAPGAAASHMPVRTMTTAGLSAGRPANNLATRTQTANRPATMPNNAPNNSVPSARQNQLSQNRPPSVSGTANNNRAGIAKGGGTWDAQGSATDRGRAPQGVQRPNAPANNSVPRNSTPNNSTQPTRFSRSDRPPWAGSGANGSTNSGFNSRSNSPTNNNSPASSNNNRSYAPPTRSYEAPNRSYSPPSRTYSAPRSNYPSPRSYSAPSNSAPSRSYSPPSRSYSAPTYSAPSRSYSAPSYSAPSRSYSAPSRSYSAPSRSYSAPSNGGSASRGSGNNAGSHAGGGGRH